MVNADRSTRSMCVPGLRILRPAGPLARGSISDPLNFLQGSRDPLEPHPAPLREGGGCRTLVKNKNVFLPMH